MYATVRTYSGSAIADALVEHEDAVRGLLTAIDGFRAYYLVKSGQATVTVSVYDDRTGAEESNRQAREWVLENLPDLSADAPEVTAGEVVVSA